MSLTIFDFQNIDKQYIFETLSIQLIGLQTNSIKFSIPYARLLAVLDFNAMFNVIMHWSVVSHNFTNRLVQCAMIDELSLYAMHVLALRMAFAGSWLQEVNYR